MKQIKWLAAAFLSLLMGASLAATLNVSQTPLFITESVSPLTMLVISRDHKLYFPAYNDASDVNGDGQINLRFDPNIDYFGYFDSYKCYNYTGSYFAPASVTASKTCSGQWSGNFLNYVTTSRLDAIRKVLYGGNRSTDGTSLTILERANIPQDAHSWGKEYTSLAVDGYAISSYTPFSEPQAGRHHLFVNTTLRNEGSGEPRMRVAENQPYRIWEWVGIERPVAGARAIHGGTGPLIDGIQDFFVHVQVCNENIGLEANCQSYPDGNFKPVGLLQEFGENDSMMFGLITGTYRNNLSGGVLRKNISSIKDEINTDTGQFTNVNGIIGTLSKLRVTGFQSNYAYQCGWITNRNIVNGECEMWGNPLGEMMYESLRYFAGKQTPTPAFSSGTGTDSALGLPEPSWNDPYAEFPRCAKANMLVISDLYPNYDGNYVPGTAFGGGYSGDLSGLNAASLAQTIFTGEGFSSVMAFIGQSGANFDSAPTPKMVSSFGNIRGLAPHESNSQGTFYSAAVAYFGWTNDLNPAEGEQNVKSFIVGLSTEQPEFTFNVGGNNITLVPFGKSVGSTSAAFPIDATEGEFQPTNSIVDYFIEEITPEKAIFRVNFEDVQQGADFDMDAIIRYEITVVGGNLQVDLISDYAAGSIIQHMGYVISGTTQDGVYLEVRDQDTAESQDINYFLDTPPGELPGGNWQTGDPLPLTASRTFTPSANQSAIFFRSPLWYAAKWGGFNDRNNNNQPDLQEEWDSDNTGQPDNFFLVTNPQTLREQLTKAFEMIAARTGSFSSAALSSGFLSTETLIYQSVFNTEKWSGQLLAFPIDVNTGDIITTGTGPNGSLWDAAQLLQNKNFNTGRRIITYNPSEERGIRFRWPGNPTNPGIGDLALNQILALSTSPVTGLADELGRERLEYIRGNRALEQSNGGQFRDRENKLGDIIDSNPVVIGIPNAGYPAMWEEGAAENLAPYPDFREQRSGRQSVLYVGANDGMLHAFNAETGEEMLAYVPAMVFPRLNQLTDPNYKHHYYVNGSPTIIDALQNGQWETVLVGTLKAGGQGVFALNVTNPAGFSETNANHIVKWEFTDADDSDMGLSFGNASIVRMHNGQWVAIFGNGYNNTVTDGNVSTSGNAVLYIVDLETGDLLRKLDTRVGMSEDPLGEGRPNGLAAPAVVDIHGNSVADFIYAGDLFGNVWKIDVTSNNPNQWDFAFKQGQTPLPFFIARDANGNRQPITTKPTVSRLPFSVSGVQVSIGTGKYFEDADTVDMSVQTVYALRDDGAGRILGRADLQEQTILAETNNARAVSKNQVANNELGWYMDLIVNGNAQGERIVSDMIFINEKLIFTTVIPSEDPCEFGGDSWLMEIDALSGARLNYNVFDMNQDGEFDDSDNITIQSGGETISVPVSGLKSEVGLVSTPSILNAGNREFKYLPGTSGGIQKVMENPGQQATGRQSWRQLQ